jgi:hypothetical protein
MALACRLSCSNLHATFSATRRRFQAHRDTTHLPCTGTRSCSLRLELPGNAECLLDKPCNWSGPLALGRNRPNYHS